MASSIQGLNGALPGQVDLASASRISNAQVPADPTPAAPAPAPVEYAGASTDLSALSAILANAIATASAQSSVRPPVVSAIRAQIAAGMYGPNLSDVAQAVARALMVG
jgi:hypothetical protein